MEEQLMKDKKIYPKNNVIENCINKEGYSIFIKFTEIIKTLGLNLEWRYYNDGKAWLGKLLNKKKNMGWLSIWNTGFKVTVYFTEKTIKEVHSLNIDDKIKLSAYNNHSGKLIPVVCTINSMDTLADIITIIEYKMTLK